METEEGLSLSLHGEDHIHIGDGLSARVLSVGEGISQELVEEAHQDFTGVVVDLEGDSLDSSSAGKSADGTLGDALDERLGGAGGSFSLGGNFA